MILAFKNTAAQEQTSLHQDYFRNREKAKKFLENDEYRVNGRVSACDNCVHFRFENGTAALEYNMPCFEFDRFFKEAHKRCRFYAQKQRLNGSESNNEALDV